jgi:hypothetical protein
MQGGLQVQPFWPHLEERTEIQALLESFTLRWKHAAYFETFSVTKALVMALPPPKALFDHDWAI